MSKGFIKVKNNTGSTILVSKAVYISGYDSESTPEVALADYSSESTMPSIGLTIEEIEDGATGYVRNAGLLIYNTNDSSVNDLVYVGALGDLIFSDPNDAGGSLISQQVGVVSVVGETGKIQLMVFGLNEKHAESHQVGGFDELSHSNLAGLDSSDAHPQYILTDGSRAFSGAVSGVSPTDDGHLATKGYVDANNNSLGDELDNENLKELSHYNAISTAIQSIRKDCDGYVLKTGGAISGNLTIGGNIINKSLRNTFQTLRQAADGYVVNSGDNMTGELQISRSSTPVAENWLKLSNSATGGAWNIRILGDATTSDNLLFDYGATNCAHLRSNGSLGIGISSAYQFQLSTDSAGKPSTNTWTVVSDTRLKEDVETADYQLCLENVKKLELKYWKWKDGYVTSEMTTDRHKLGWIAQEVKEVFPRSVSEKKCYGLKDCNDLNADQIYATTFGAVKQLIDIVEKQQKQIDFLIKEVELLKKAR